MKFERFVHNIGHGDLSRMFWFAPIDVSAILHSELGADATGIASMDHMI